MSLFLSPLLSGSVREVLAEPDRLAGMVEALGSPLNIVLPQQMTANAHDFLAVYAEHHLTGKVYFAHKANKSSALIRELAVSEVGVDVASLGELRHALAAGITGDKIMATGPKDLEFLYLAAKVGAVVNADSGVELERLADIVARHQLPRVRVMIRLSAFDSPGVKVLSRPSRFGVHQREMGELLGVLARHRDMLDLLGMAYHLDTNGLDEKALALEGCLLAMREATVAGFAPTAIDIGGGFGVNYLRDREEWESYTTELGHAVLGTRPAMTWQNHGYGLRAEAGTLRGTLGVYPGYRPVAGAGYLDELLRRTAPSLGRSFATLLLENMYDLYIEPGRALADQCGITLARVEEVRTTHGGDHMVRLAANSRDISAEEHAVLMDPLLVPAEPMVDRPAEVFLTGNLCLEDDLITRRKVSLPRLPAVGELLAFANTAGYFMDFAADDALMQPVARKAAIYPALSGGWSWCLDTEYWPVKGGRS
ncbi:Y4yA family PLP-dependent enzyme [Nocardia sp. NPDC050710]|uniref:Y4yA family PLP-dependent enzyme n=1 Tax=Nocardia sp. NPDC050710 TaxID=3157220 RepID=UPI0033F57198